MVKLLFLGLLLSSCDMVNSYLIQKQQEVLHADKSNEVLAEVGTQKILVKDLKRTIAVDDLSFEAKNMILDNLISEKIIEQMASSVQLVVTDDEIESEILKKYEDETSLDKVREVYSDKWVGFKQKIRLDILVKHLKERLPVPSDKQINTVYDTIKKKSPKLCVSDSLIRVSHIFVVDEENSLKVKTALENKEGSFEDISRKYSLAPEGKVGGDLGWISKGELTPIFDIYFDKPLNFVSPPIPSQEGIHFVKITGRQDAPGRDNRSCISEVKSHIKNDYTTKYFDEWLEEEKNKRKITKNTVLLKDL